LFSLWTSQSLTTISLLPTLTLRFDTHPDTRVVGFTALAALAAAIVLGGIGTVQAVRPNLVPALNEDATASIGGGRPARLRGVLVALQITVSLLLVVGAGLFLRSARAASSMALGFDPRGVVALDVDASVGRMDPESLPLFRVILERISALSGVDSAAVSTRAPLDSSTPLVRVNANEAVAAGDQRSPTVSFQIVSSRFFDVVRMPIVAGRAFTDTDDRSRLPVAIVNETLAARLWPDGDAIGRQLWLEPRVSPKPCVIVGIARNSKYLTLGEERQGHVYLPFAQQPRGDMALLVRSSNEPRRMFAELDDVLHSVDPDLQGFFARTLVEHIGVSLLPVRLAAKLAAAVGGLR
jgi:hypothetical protein